MSKTLFAWGSSTIEYMDASLASLAASVSRGVFNGGDAGARADATLAQQGTIPASIDFGGAVLTQGQSVAVAVSNIQPSLMIKQWAGTVEGTAISGILSYTDNGWMFRRTDAGEAATVPAATRFLPTLPDDAGAIQIINVGKNDVLSGTSAAEIFDKTGLMHADVADNAGTIVVLGHFVVRDSNAPQQARVLELNRLLAEKYGDAYVDVQSYLMSARIWTDMALAPTEDDLARQARGVLPASLALDGLHLSDAANVAVTANLLRPHLLERGVAADPGHFWGTSAAETLVANASNDQLLGFAGNDVLVGGAGADRLDGGAGIDSASYQNSAAGVRADMISPNTNAGDAAGDRYISIENLVGSSHDDTLYADNLANAIFGGDGNDALSGRGGDDTLSGGNGNDMFYGGLGADLIDGGAGIDMVSFEFSSSGAVEVDLANPSVNTAEATGDIYANVENLRGSYLGDRLTGTDGTNRIEGYNGDDFIYGGKSEKDLRDVISGDDGNDWIELGYGNDEGYGGNGNDTVDGGFGADVIIGNEGDDQLSGSALGDMLFGGGGGDYLNGGFGFDRLNGGEGADRFFHLGNRNHGADWVQDYNAAQNDVLEFGRTGTAADFKVNFARTGNAGSDEVDEAFVIHIPSGQIVWALVDGAAQDHLWLTVQGVQQDLLI